MKTLIRARQLYTEDIYKDYKDSFLPDLKKFLYDFFGKKEKDSTDPGFKYVGLLEYSAGKQNCMLYFLPKYYDMAQIKSAKEILDKTTPVYKHFSLVLKTINKYRLEKSLAIKENRLQTQLELETETADHNSKLAVAVTLIEDYLENGVYTNMKNRRSLCGNGEIDWQHTINTVTPLRIRTSAQVVALVAALGCRALLPALTSTRALLSTTSLPASPARETEAKAFTFVPRTEGTSCRRAT